MVNGCGPRAGQRAEEVLGTVKGQGQGTLCRVTTSARGNYPEKGSGQDRRALEGAQIPPLRAWAVHSGRIGIRRSWEALLGTVEGGGEPADEEMETSMETSWQGWVGRWDTGREGKGLL